MEKPRDKPDFATLAKQLADESSTMVRQQVALARAETDEKILQVKAGVKSLVIGGALMLIALVYILDAVLYGLARVLPFGYQLWLGALLVGIATFIGAIVLFKNGGIRLFTSNPMPSRSIASVKRDVRIIKGGS